jgi:PAS domain S-box-containing protein
VYPVESQPQIDAERMQRLERQNAVWTLFFRQAHTFWGADGAALRSITRLTAEALEVEELGIWLHDEDRHALVAADHFRLPADRHTSGQFVRLHEPDAERLPWRAARTQALEETSSDARAAVLVGIWTHPPRVNAALIGAIRRRGRVTGLIAAGHVGSRRTWHADEEEFVAAIADLTATVLDAQEQRRTAQDVERVLESQQQIIESAATAVYLTDEEDRIRDVNEAFCAATGYVPEEIQGQPSQILEAEASPADGETGGCTASVAAERVFRQRCRLKGKGDRRLEVIRNISVIRGGEGQVRGRLVSFADVTRIVEVQRRLETALAEAEKARREAVGANESKSHFLANMSHEIRTPMNAILGLTDLVLEEEIAPTQRERLELVQSSAESLLGLLNDILDLAKIEAGRLELEPIEFSLRDAIVTALSPIAQRAAQKGLDFRWSFDAALPDTVVGDPTRLRQVLINLAENAVKFTERGWVEVHLAPESVDDSSLRLHVAVRDTGIGIGADRLDAIFEAFTQADGSTTRKYGGTGLGTTIARQLVECMGGQIWVESILGSGSSFHFTVALSRSASTRSLRPEDGPRTDPGARTVLVADGDDASRTLVARMLERKGWRVLRASDAHGAMQTLTETRCDVVLVDLRLGEPDGIDTIRRIRAGGTAAGGGVPILVMASDAVAVERMSLAELGIQGLIDKPIDRQLLLRALERAWAARTAQRLAA